MTGHPLELSGYRDLVHLDQPFRPAAPPAPADELEALAGRILELERHPVSDRRQARAELRRSLTRRAPHPFPPDVVPLLDALHAGAGRERPVTDARHLPALAVTSPGTRYPAADTAVLWRGDITTLRADAIVNAANSALLGCFRPLHPCVDNAVHTVAGPRLRQDCHTIITRQGGPEPTGTAKVTRGYHLPARFVLHTVGPIVHGPLQPEHEAALASAYRSCLDLAARVDAIRTVALCSVGTGVFGYPKAPAARLALQTVATWLSEHPGRLDRVVFTAFEADDLHVHQQAVSRWDDRR